MIIRYGFVSEDFSIAPRLPTSAGVYLFLGPADRIMYVGMAHNLEAVLYRYKGLRGRKKMKDRRAAGAFDRVAWLACAQPETAPTLERIAISRFRPPWNDQHNPSPRSATTALALAETEKKWLEDAERELSQMIANSLASGS